MRYHFLGDVHGAWNVVQNSINNIPANEPLIQVGDLGIGFPPIYVIGEGYTYEPESFAPNFKFIRGNHDNPLACQGHPNFLNDWGYNNALKIFFVGGGHSIDKDSRTIGKDWWPDEELSIPTLIHMITLYEELKPDIVITHEAPARLCGPGQLIDKYFVSHSRTAQALDTMLDIHHPKRWIFGHHHRHLGSYVNGTHFICLDINELLSLDL